MKVRNTNGVSFGAKYVIKSSDAPVSAVKEVITVVVTGEPTASADLTITLRGVATTVAVLDADTIDDVATKIRAVPVTGWVITGATDTIIYTASVAGAKTGVNSFGAGTTGVTATVTLTTPGTDATGGYVDFDFRIGSFRYALSAIANIYRLNVLTNPVDLAISYPFDGVVRVTGTLVADDVIGLLVQRDSLN